MYRLLLFCIFFGSCRTITPLSTNRSNVTGSSFYKTTAAWQWQQRDSLAATLLLAGAIPSFLNHFVAIHVSITNTLGRTIKATYYVMPDYLSVGTNEDWARVPVTPQSAQKIADQYHCFLPTRKMVDDIYQQAKIKLEPVPMYASRDSSVTMWQHHLIIEGQRQGRKGLVAGIKKDVVVSSKLQSDPRKNRVAIYGWHQTNGKAIQPLYTGHVNWYVDYSHGVRLIYQTIWVNGKPMNYKTILTDPLLKGLLCDEEQCDPFNY